MIKWQTKKISEITQLFADGDWIEKKDQSDDGIRLIQTGNVGLGYFKDRAEKARYISEKTFKRLNCTEILSDDVLISRLPDPVGRACIISNTGEKMITAVDCTIIRFNEDILSKWFIYYSLSSEYQKQIDKEVGGATRQRISRKNLGDIVVPVPPLPEQKRIVKILDETFKKLEKTKGIAEKNLQNSKELFESSLAKIFVDLRKNSKYEKFGNLCKFVRGPFGGSLKKTIFKKEGFVVYEQQHAIYNQFQDVRYFIDKRKFNEMKRFELFPGDLIMSCSGTMGKIAIVPSQIKRGIINQALLKLTPSKKILGEYLKYWMQSSDFQDGLKIYSKGAAIKNVVSVKILKEIEIPFTEVSNQKTIIKKLDQLSEQTKNLELIYQKKISAIEELKRSILSKAFSKGL